MIAYPSVGTTNTALMCRKEVVYISRRSAPIQVVMHYPPTEAGTLELARRVASVHADAVNRKIQKLTCPTQQKQRLLAAIIQAAASEDGSQGP